ncbi:hypothetical protein STEG23_033460, partial [Scotinomys teguina]
MVPVGSAGHLDLHGPNGSMVLKPQHGSKYGPRSQASTMPSMATGALDITGSVCGTAVDSDMALATAQTYTTPWSQVGAHVTEVCTSLAAAQPSGMKKAT